MPDQEANSSITPRHFRSFDEMQVAFPPRNDPTMPASNEALAAVFCPHVRQQVVVFPLVWKHDVDGDWYLAEIMGNSEWWNFNVG